MLSVLVFVAFLDLEHVFLNVCAFTLICTLSLRDILLVLTHLCSLLLCFLVMYIDTLSYQAVGNCQKYFLRQLAFLRLSLDNHVTQVCFGCLTDESFWRVNASGAAFDLISRGNLFPSLNQNT